MHDFTRIVLLVGLSALIHGCTVAQSGEQQYCAATDALWGQFRTSTDHWLAKRSGVTEPAATIAYSLELSEMELDGIDPKLRKLISQWSTAVQRAASSWEEIERIFLANGDSLELSIRLSELDAEYEAKIAKTEAKPGCMNGANMINTAYCNQEVGLLRAELLDKKTSLQRRTFEDRIARGQVPSPRPRSDAQEAEFQLLYSRVEAFRQETPTHVNGMLDRVRELAGNCKVSGNGQLRGPAD